MTSETIPTIADRVAAGIRLLDEKGPAHWRDKVNASKLNISCAWNCLLGQLYGFSEGLDALEIRSRSYLYGFSRGSDDPYETCDELNTEWKRRLTETTGTTENRDARSDA